MKQKFTLIELLVVIAIMGRQSLVLFSLGGLREVTAPKEEREELRNEKRKWNPSDSV